jgi:glycerate 2-kinase
MRILVAPDKFKGVRTAREVATNIALGIRDIFPGVEIDLVPVADGGEGTAEVICATRGGQWQQCPAHDAFQRPMTANWMRSPDGSTAVMEMCEVAGTKHLDGAHCDIDRATTFGVGEMILAAAHGGARQIIIGLGGSITNDGGFGLARALGFRFFDGSDCQITDSVSALGSLSRIDSSRVVEIFSAGGLRPRITAAADVRNPLLGNDGATRVFGPQKHASLEQVDLLEHALQRLADVVSRDLGVDFRFAPGAGAAGGLGFGLMTFCRAVMERGFDVVAHAIDFEEKVQAADVVVTGEGSLDRQTLEGKAPAEVASLARRLGKRVFAVVGRSDGDVQVSRLFDAVYAVAETGRTDEENIKRADELLREGGRKVARLLLSGGA